MYALNYCMELLFIFVTYCNDSVITEGDVKVLMESANTEFAQSKRDQLQ